MAMSIDEVLAKGERKLRAKADIMSKKWEARKALMISNYRAVPWIGPVTKDSYEAGINAATHRVDIDKWKRNFREGISR